MFQCPQCQSIERFDVQVSTYVEVQQSWDGEFEADDSRMNGDKEWDDNSNIRCMACDHWGNLAQFEIGDEEYAAVVKRIAEEELRSLQEGATRALRQGRSESYWAFEAERLAQYFDVPLAIATDVPLKEVVAAIDRLVDVVLGKSERDDEEGENREGAAD